MAYVESASVSAAPFNGQKASTAEDSIMKNVNLYRGTVMTNVKLVSFDGLDGLDVSIAACYQPEDEVFFKPNRLCGAQVLGNGMAMPLAAILTKNRAMKETYQSDYYISGEGGQFPLYRVGAADGCVEFMSIEHPFWKFKMYGSKWEVARDDGSIWTYGGTNDSLEINVCWGNWTGPCNDSGGNEFPVGWYLSKVVSRYGNSIGFSYENLKLPLGGCAYTSEIHLKAAVSVFGQTAKLNYLPKRDDEYGLPHDTTNGVNQFLCEKHYLDSLDVYSSENKLLYSQKLSYKLAPAADGEVKRLLTAVSQVAKDGEFLPPLRLEWNTEGDFAGHVSKITYPREGALEFDYSKRAVSGYAPETFLDCDNNWHKSIANGVDFTAALFTEKDSAMLKILSWDMSWQIYDDKPMLNRAVKDAKLFLGNGLVVVRYLSANDNNYALRIIKRDPVRRYDWEGFDVNLQSAVCPSVACGADFVAVQYPDRNGLKVYQFNYSDNVWHEFELPVDAMERQIIGAGNGCVFGAYSCDNSKSVRIVTFYSDEKHEWRVGDSIDVSALVTWDYEASLPVWSINGSIASACFVSDNADFVDATMVAVSWDSGFRITGTEKISISQPKTAGNPIFYSVATGTMIGFANVALRYTPSGFVRKSLFDVSADCDYAYAYGGDMFLGVERQANGTQRFCASRFDAVFGEWTDDGIPYADAVSNLSDICRPLVTADYAILGRSIFLRGADERWANIGYLPDEADITTARVDPNGGYLLYSVPQANLARFVPISPLGLGDSTDIPGGHIGGDYYYEAGQSCFFLTSAPGLTQGISFYNIYRQNYHTNPPKIALLEKVTLNSGSDKQTVFLDYDMDSARLESNVFAAGVACVLPAAKDGSFGKTVYSYFNGGAPSREQYPFVDAYCNVADFYTHFAGQVNGTTSYDGYGIKESESRCFMKAFDSHGFCILQTKITKSDFVKKFYLTTRNFDPVSDEIKTSVEYEYEPQYHRRRKISQRAYDKNGDEIVTSQTMRYAFEDYPEMKTANILNDLSMFVKKNESEKIILDAAKYQYGKNSSGYYYQTAEHVMGRTEGEWLANASVTLVDSHCKTLCETDERGISTSTLYDRSGLYPVAITKDAEPEEVLYCGFEPYESTNRLTIDGNCIDGYITQNERFSGTCCLNIPLGKRLVARVEGRDTGLRMRFSVKSSGMFRAFVDFGKGEVSEKSFMPEDGWTTHTEIFFSKHMSKSVTVTIYGDADIYVDALYITPILAKGDTYVYTNDLKLQTASHRNYGPGTRTYFDRYHTQCATTSDDGNFVSFTNTVYGEGGVPNEMYTVKPSSEGEWYDSRQGYSKNPMFEPDGSSWNFAQSDNFALLFSSEESMPSILFGSVEINCSGGMWTLKNGSEQRTREVPKGNFYLLIKIGNRCRFYGDGVILFSFIFTGNNDALELKNASDVGCIGYIPNPNISLSCADYSGRVLQDQIVTEDGIMIVHTVYNELGVQLARTTQVEIPGVFWGYRNEFVTSYNAETGAALGEINSLFPESEGFPCTSFKTTHSPAPKIMELAQPGKNFAFGSGFTVKHASFSAAGFATFIKDGFCTGEAVTDPDGIIIANIGDGKGKILGAKIAADGSMNEITAYELDARGNTTKIYYPNYFDGSASSEKFVSTIEYDSLGNVTSRKDPDADKVLTAYDHFGKLRFIKQDESSEQYIYHLYDKFGRETEIGYVAATWDNELLHRAADEDNVRPSGAIPVKQLLYDEILDARLTRIVTTVDGKTVEEYNEYDKYGRPTRYILSTDGRTEECITAYDAVGNVTSRTTGSPVDGVIEYSYGLNRELTGVKYNGNVIYSCGYSTQGSLAFEDFGDNIRREYRYNTANYLMSIEGAFFSQQIKYFGVRKGGQISNVQTQFSFDCEGSFKKISEFSAAYDALGRIATVRVSGNNPLNYSYDANGNQLKESIAYESGSDRFVSVDGNDISYEGFGAIKVAASRFELQYDHVTQIVTRINSDKEKISYIVGSGICGFDSGNGLTLSVHSEDGKLFFERGADGKAVILVYGANGAFAQILNGKVYYLIRDYRSSICGISDNNTLLAAYNYDIFGNITDIWESEFLPSQLIPLRFAGARYEECGLYRFRMRFYDPTVGRFLSFDPEVQYSNPYIYGGCDWINYFDPDGAFNIGGFFASLLVGIALTIVGVAITVATAGIGGAAGIALGILGAGIIGAGIASTIYSVTSAINKDFSWSSWGISMGAGAVFGMVAAGVGAAMPATMGVAGSIIYDGVSGMIVGAADGVVTNGLLNISSGKEFCDNIVSNAITGVVLGGVMGSFTGMSTAARNAKNFVKQGGQNVAQLGICSSLGGTKAIHSKIGVRGGNVGDSVMGGHLVYGNPQTQAALCRTTLYDYNPNVKWLNVEHSVFNNVSASLGNIMNGQNIGRYSKIFNSCTSYVIQVSADAGIYQPLWARSPLTLNCWAFLTRSFQR